MTEEQNPYQSTKTISRKPARTKRWSGWLWVTGFLVACAIAVLLIRLLRSLPAL